MAKIDGCGTVELATSGDVEIGREDYLGPGAGAISGRSVLVGLDGKIGKFKVGEERNDARFGVWARNDGIGGSSIRRTDSELCLRASGVLRENRSGKKQNGDQYRAINCTRVGNSGREHCGTSCWKRYTGTAEGGSIHGRMNTALRRGN